MRFAADTLNGVPSIVIGVFVYGIAVLPFRQFSALAGGLALGIMMVPLIMRTTEELLRLVPTSLKEGALALGATRARAVFTVVLPAALPGIMTGILLALARIAGETAPLLFTALNNRYFSTDIRQPISTLTVQVFTYAVAPNEDWHRQAWAGALVLVGDRSDLFAPGASRYCAHGATPARQLRLAPGRRRNAQVTKASPPGHAGALPSSGVEFMEPALDDRDKASARPKPGSPTSINRVPRVLVVEDEQDIAGLIKHTLERSGDGRVDIVSSGDAALRAVTEQTPDLVILDLNLPVLSGTEVCRILRGRPATANVPIIMLTARTAESDRVTGLDLGADDYVTKPFSLRELAARVRAVLRRRQQAAAIGANVYTGAHLRADFDAVAISVDGTAVRLTRREFELLKFLVENRNRVLSRDRLLERVWGYDRFIETRSVDVHVGRLRSKLGAAGTADRNRGGAGLPVRGITFPARVAKASDCWHRERPRRVVERSVA